MPEVSKKDIKQVTISDILKISGEGPEHNGLHVFYKKKKNKQEHKISYPFRSDAFFVVLITGSDLHIRLNLFDYHLKKNDLLIIGPNTVREFVDASEGCSMTGLMFTPDFLIHTGLDKRFMGTFDFFTASGSPHLALEEQEAEDIVQLIQILHRKNTNTKNIESGLEIEVIRHHFLAFLFELAGLYSKNPAIPKIAPSRKEELATRFLKLLPANIRKQRSLQFYADHLFVTPNYLSKTVKEVSGKTAGEFIDEMVMMEAKVLLSDLSLSVAQVSEQLFFSDQFFFSKFFKHHAGITPTGYRKTV